MRNDITIRDAVLVHAAMFGLGDFYMSRLLFGTLKRQFPGKRLHYAIPPRYLEALSCHPDVEAVDINGVIVARYEQSFDISVLHGAWTSRQYYSCHRPLQHPCDHMATRCGVTLPRDADMKFRLGVAEIARGRELLAPHGGPVALLCPRSSRYDRDLSSDHLEALARHARDRGYAPVALHSEPTPTGDIPLLEGLTIREVMGVVHASHHVVSVETSHHHLAGGMGKPTLALYSFCCGHRYSRYYPRCVVRQEHEGIEKCVNMARMPIKMILNGYNEMLETYGDQR